MDMWPSTTQAQLRQAGAQQDLPVVTTVYFTSLYAVLISLAFMICQFFLKYYLGHKNTWYKCLTGFYFKMSGQSPILCI